jgi:response regulator RpfG family c-di-GMP phosphodiesterase
MPLFQTILLIDDDNISNFITEKLILREDFAQEVTSFLCGDSALAYLKEREQQQRPAPDIIFLDLNMPEMDGWEFISEFKKLPLAFTERSRVFMLSSAVDSKDIVQARNMEEIEDFISKPLTKEDMGVIRERFTNKDDWENY